MSQHAPIRHRPVWAALLLVGFVLGMTVAVLAQANGQLILGQAGAISGALTLMPPDASGWYHIDNPGGQMLRISGGGTPGGVTYMTVADPGKVTIYGDLQVTGQLIGVGLQSRGSAPSFPSMQPVHESGDQKADSASSEDVQYLQNQVDQLTRKVNELVARVNALSR